MQAKILQHFTF